jgi:hypothetical protein
MTGNELAALIKQAPNHCMTTGVIVLLPPSDCRRSSEAAGGEERRAAPPLLHAPPSCIVLCSQLELTPWHRGCRGSPTCADNSGPLRLGRMGEMDTGQKTESVLKLVEDISLGSVALPEFQRDFVWDVEKTFDLFDSFVRDIFVGSLIYGTPSFEITVRELDNRPRSGRGSRSRLRLTSFTREEIERKVKVKGFRLLLDGQQRATALYRALTGIDSVYFVVLPDDELPSSVRATSESQRTLEEVLKEFRGDALQEHVSVSLSDVFRSLRGEAPREKDKAQLFLTSNKFSELNAENVEDSEEFVTYLTQLKNLENLFRQEKLVAYYLLDTDEEKFALFFERSNSKGMQLNFIDILAAKLYSGFNLRAAIDEFEDDHPNIELNREVLVRSISFRVSGGKEMERAYILASLNSTHFNDHWREYTSAYRAVLDYLVSTKLLIHPAWMPYENMMIPLIAFVTALPRPDFSQVSLRQASLIRLWYWLAILSRRYSSAAQTFALEDAQAMHKAAAGDFGGLISIIQRTKPLVRTKDDLLSVHKRYDALYKGILNLIHCDSGGLRNLENNNPVSMMSNLEDHHIYPKDYLRRNWDSVHQSLDSDMSIDCIINRTLIPKLTNVKVSNKPPSQYLNVLASRNAEFDVALRSHFLSNELLTGDYDNNYDFFLDERAGLIMDAIERNVIEQRRILVDELTPILDRNS